MNKREKNVNIIVAEMIMTDKQIEEREGEHFDLSHDKFIIDEDTDVYKPDGTILLRFRKSVIPHEISQTAMNSLRKISMKNIVNPFLKINMI